MVLSLEHLGLVILHVFSFMLLCVCVTRGAHIHVEVRGQLSRFVLPVHVGLWVLTQVAGLAEQVLPPAEPSLHVFSGQSGTKAEGCPDCSVQLQISWTPSCVIPCLDNIGLSGLALCGDRHGELGPRENFILILLLCIHMSPNTKCS